VGSMLGGRNRTTIINNGVPVNNGGGFNNGGGRGPVRQSRGNGCSTVLMIIAVLVIVLMVVSFCTNMNINPGAIGSQAGNVTVSTRVREPLAANLRSTDTGSMITDNMHILNDQNIVANAMRNFQSQTGVRPYLYITGSLPNITGTPTLAQLQSFTDQTYRQLFGNDESRMLLVVLDPEDIGGLMISAGGNALSVIDDEAANIIYDLIDHHATVGTNWSSVFANAFNDAADTIMYRPSTLWRVLLIVGAVLIIGAVIAYKWWQKKKAQDNLEAEQTERILSQDLNTFGNAGTATISNQEAADAQIVSDDLLQPLGETNAEDLAKLYENKE